MGALLVALVFTGVSQAEKEQTLPIRDTTAKKYPQRQQAPLVLPNIEAEVAALRAADRSVAQKQLASSRNVIAFWKGRGKWLLAPGKAKCWDVEWQRSCTVARASHRLHLALAAVAQKRLQSELPNTNDWVTAVRIAQRVYPGTSDWMLYISDREGGHGPWVWYGGRTWSGYHIGDDFLGADTVGGWMQFRFSTFAPYWRGMIKDLRARGITLPPVPNRGGPSEYQPWLWPLGQALTAGYMKYYGKEGCHWCL
jgi:hypothetical protein